MHEHEQDIDPDSNFFDHLNNTCCYYTDDQYNLKIKPDQGMSIIHFNSRSLYANHQNIKEYLEQFQKPFNIIAISETWLSSEKGVDFELNGYELNYINRIGKRGGGVALYIKNSLKYKVVECMSTTIDNLMDCITVEICMEKQKNVIVSCVYRAPDSSIEAFKDSMEVLFAKTQKVTFICGDFNIDLLNPNKHRMTDEFINTMYGLSLYPLITKPSRITAHCATLIDNIFTNYMENSLVSGLLLNDISDHLPVFVIHDCNCGKEKEDHIINHRRIRTDESINAFRNDLTAQNWNNLYEERDIDKAYETFLNTFQSLYDKNCPIKKSNGRQNQNHTSRPWITKGLHNACKKKEYPI